MSDADVIRFCSPTLAGLKTGSLFSCTCDSLVTVNDEVRKLNTLLVPKGLRVLPLRVWAGRALIYVFRPKRLNADLTDPMVRSMLNLRGYPTENADRCVAKLAQRLKESTEFPHEIGLFLGYPPVDVLGFIENRAENCKCVGDWKVYGDEQTARALFRKYRKCTDAYSTLFAQGMPLYRLAVATPN